MQVQWPKDSTFMTVACYALIFRYWLIEYVLRRITWKTRESGRLLFVFGNHHQIWNWRIDFEILKNVSPGNNIKSIYYCRQCKKMKGEMMTKNFFDFMRFYPLSVEWHFIASISHSSMSRGVIFVRYFTNIVS